MDRVAAAAPEVRSDLFAETASRMGVDASAWMASKEGKCSSGGRVNRFVLASVNMTMADLLIGFVNDDDGEDA